MAMINSNRYVFIIKDSLEEYEHLLAGVSQNMNIHSAYFEQLESLIEEIDHSEIKRDKTILLVNHMVGDNERVKKINQIFLNRFNFENPHIIFLVKKEDADFDQKKSVSQYKYYYLLSFVICKQMAN